MNACHNTITNKASHTRISLLNLALHVTLLSTK